MRMMGPRSWSVDLIVPPPCYDSGFASSSPAEVRLDLELQQFAAQRSDAVWKIDQSQLLDSVERGQSVAEFVAFLETRAGQPLPANVAVFFNEVAERVLKVVDRGPARLVEVQDKALAQRLQAFRAAQIAAVKEMKLPDIS